MKNTLAAPLIYFLCLISSVLFFGLFQDLNRFEIVIGLMNWDAMWYESIVKEGYQYIPLKSCNLAFFPLFPAVWNLISNDVLIISTLNATFFLMAFIWMTNHLGLSIGQKLFLLSTGSFIFFYLPYSESLFFLFGTMILIGYKTHNRLLLYTGIFLISLTRAVTITFIPILIFTELTTKRSIRKSIKQTIITTIVAMGGTAIAAGFQYLQTGKLFYFMEVQKYWRRELVWPINFHFTTYSPERMIASDAIALCIGLAAIITCTYHLYKTFFTKMGSELSYHQVFSIGYLAIVTIIDCTFTFQDNGMSSLWSINRHIFCTPFYIVFAALLLNIKLSTMSKYLLVSIVILSFVLTELSGYPLMAILYFCYFSYFIYVRIRPKITLLSILYMICNILFQIYLFVHFVDGKWIG